MKRLKLLLVLITFIFVPITVSAKIDDSHIKSIVQVKIWDTYKSEYVATGSGVFIDELNILTNYHVAEDVISNPDRYLPVVCITNDSLSLPDCKYIFSAYGSWSSFSEKPKVVEELDLALLQFRGIITSDGIKEFVSLPFSDWSDFIYHKKISISIYGEKLTGLKVGDQVQTLGYPAEGGNTITYSNGSIINFQVNKYDKVLSIITSARIGPGSSGGAAFDSYGKFIGVTSGGYLDSDGNFISGVIIPVSTVNWWLQREEGYRVNKDDEYTVLSEEIEKTIKEASCLNRDDRYWDESSGTCICNSGYFRDSESNCVKEKISSCSDGYILSNNKCITHTENCKNHYGGNIYGVKGGDGNSSCHCLSGYNWSSSEMACVEISSEIKGVDHLLFPEGALIRATNGIDIYIVKYVGSKKFKRLILSPSVFNNYGHLKWEDVMDVSQATLNSFTTSELVRAVDDDKIYRLYAQGDTGQKRMIKNNSVLTRLGLDPDSVYEINKFDRESYVRDLDLE